MQNKLEREFRLFRSVQSVIGLTDTEQLNEKQLGG